MVVQRRLGPLLMAGTLAATEIGGGSSLGVAPKNGMSGYGLCCLQAITMGLASCNPSLICRSEIPCGHGKNRSGVLQEIRWTYNRNYRKVAPLVGTYCRTVYRFGYSPCWGCFVKFFVIIVAVVVTVHSIMGGSE